MALLTAEVASISEGGSCEGSNPGTGQVKVSGRVLSFLPCCLIAIFGSIVCEVILGSKGRAAKITEVWREVDPGAGRNRSRFFAPLTPRTVSAGPQACGAQNDTVYADEKAALISEGRFAFGYLVPSSVFLMKSAGASWSSFSAGVVM